VSVESKRREVDYFMVNKRIAFIQLIPVILLLLLSGCDHEIATIDYVFGHPPRIVYIVGVDTELDFADVTLVSVHRNGHRNEAPFDEFGPDWVTVEHNVDFDTPGVYEVEIVVHPSIHHRFYITFFVQVIDEDVFNDLSGRTE
jgi:hypothetical protein